MTEQLKFGTSGLRGLVSDLTDDIITRYTSAFLRHLEKIGKINKDKSVIVGYDLRSSSPHIKNVVIKTIEDEGFSVINAGQVPTPALALYSLNSRYPAIMRSEECRVGKECNSRWQTEHYKKNKNRTAT